MIKDSTFNDLIKGKIKVLGYSFEHYAFSFFDSHFPQKMERIRPVLSAPCGESVRLLVCLYLSRLLCYCMKSWTCNHPRKAVIQQPADCSP